MEAKSECRLDRDFPSPLMTPTLTKVSNIAKVQFDFLDHHEQEQLISDLEHLLITEFPDHELRKETRLSFSAKMLSRLAPKLDRDISELYKIEEEIFDLLYEKEKKAALNRRAKKKAKNIDNEFEMKVASLNKNREDGLEKLNRNDHQIKTHVAKLISKAIYENHDKLTLWSSLINYYQKSGYSDLQDVFKLLERLKETEKINDTSKEYIYSYLLQSIVNSLIMACRIIVNPKANYIQKQRALSFHRGVQKIDLDEVINLKEKKYYLDQSMKIFLFARHSILFLFSQIKDKNDFLKSFYLEVFGGKKLHNWVKFHNYCKNTKYGFASWIWWILQKTLDRKSYTPNPIWELALHDIELDDEVAWTIYSLYPGHLGISQLENMSKHFEISKNKYENYEGWWFDVQRGLEKRGIEYSNEKLERYKTIRRLNGKEKDYVTLYEWVDWANRRHSEIIHDKYDHEDFGSFDPRISEWTAIEIIRQIAGNMKSYPLIIKESLFGLSVDEDESEILLRKIHPSNYLIPKVWIKTYDRLSWEGWRKKVTEKTVTFRGKIIV